MTDKVIRVVIADEHHSIRAGLKTFLANNNSEIVGEAETGLGAINLCAETKPDLLIIDVSAYGTLGGIEVIYELRHFGLPIKILAISTDQSEAIAFAAGADGYINKWDLSKQLVLTLRKLVLSAGAVSFIAASSNISACKCW